MRLFAAVTPPDDVLEHLETALASVRGVQGSGLRWTLPEARHITVAFYGEVSEGYLDDVVGALDDVAPAHRSFEAVLRGAGLFDGRTLWVGCSGDGWGPLMSAAGQVGTDLFGRAEDRRSRPHLTVARVAGRGRGTRGPARGAGPEAVAPVDPAALAHALALYTGPTWTVDEVALMSSRPGAGPGGSSSGLPRRPSRSVRCTGRARVPGPPGPPGPPVSYTHL